MTTRIRERDDFENGTWNAYAYRQSTGALYKTYSSATRTVGGSKQIVIDEYDAKNKFKVSKQTVPPLRAVQMSKLEYLHPKPFQQQTYVSKPAGVSYSYKQVGPPIWLAPTTDITLGVFKPSAELGLVVGDPKVNSYLLQRAYSRMSTAEYDFGVTVGEVAETAAMLAPLLSGVVKLSLGALAGVRAIYKHGLHTSISIAKNATSRETKRLLAVTRKHPIDSSLRIIDESANHWLAYKFGALPFIDDIGKVLEFQEKNVTETTGLRIARVRGKVSDKTETLSVANRGVCLLYYDAFVIKRTIDQHNCGVYFRNKCNAPLVNFMEKIGFAPWQLPSLAYELIPLSFVVDRFIDIKSFVRGNIGSLEKQTFGSYHSRKVITQWTYNTSRYRVGSTADSYLVQDSPSSVGSVRLSQLARSINHERPCFPVVNPYWRDQLIADATNLSLIWGRLRTHVGKLF